MASFGRRVTELRKEKGLTQAALAEAVGVSKNTVSVWERDVRKPEFDTLTDLCSFFNVNMSYLIGEEVARAEAPGAVPDDETAALWALYDLVEESEPIIKKYMQLGNEARSMINAAINTAYKYERENGELYKDGRMIRLKIARDEPEDSG